MKTNYFKALIFLLSMLFLVNENIKAQTKLKIKYECVSIEEDYNKYLKNEFKYKSKNNLKWIEFHINDSLAFYKASNLREFEKAHDEKYYENIELGNYFEGKSMYFDYKKNQSVKAFFIKNKMYSVIDSIVKDTNWIVLDSLQRVILGYNTTAAIKKNNNEIVEIVWFSKQLNCNFNFLSEINVPGIVLERFVFKTNWLYKAVGISEKAATIIYPTKGNFLSKAELEKLIFERKQKEE